MITLNKHNASSFAIRRGEERSCKRERHPYAFSFETTKGKSRKHFFIVFAVMLLFLPHSIVCGLSVADKERGAQLGASLVKEAVELVDKANSGQDLDQALSKLQQALKIFKDADLKRQTAFAAFLMGQIYTDLKKAREATSYLTMALKFAEEADDGKIMARTYTVLGEMAYGANDVQSAIGAFELAAAVAAKIKDPELAAGALRRLGEASFRAGKLNEAEESWKTALQLAEKLRDYRGAADMLGNLALLYKNWGRYEDALQNLKSDLDLRKRIGDRKGEAEACGMIADVYVSSGNTEAGMKWHKRAYDIGEDIGDKITVAHALGNIASCLMRTGKYDAAADLLEKDLAIRKEIGDRKGIAEALFMFGDLYLQWGQLERAVLCDEKALEIFIQIGDRKYAGYVLTSLGQLYQAQNQHHQAVQCFEKSYAVLKDVGVSTAAPVVGLGECYIELGKLDEATRLLEAVGERGSLGKLYLAKREYDKAQTVYMRMLQEAQHAQNSSRIFAAHTGLGLASENLGDYWRAAENYRGAIAHTEDLRSNLSADRRSLFLAAKIEGFDRIAPYKGLVRVLAKLKHPEEALNAAEYTKARNFANLMSSLHGKEYAGVPREVVEKHFESSFLLSKLEEALREADEKRNEAAVATLQSMVNKARNELKLQVEMLRREYPLYATTLYPQPLKIQDAPLNQDEWVIAYEVTSSSVVLWLLRGKAIVKHSVKSVTQADLRRLVEAFRKPIEGITQQNFRSKLSAFNFAAGKRLSDILVGDILPELPMGKPVIVVPDDCLGELPFEMLVLNEGGKVAIEGDWPHVVGAQFLADRNPLSYYQSITALTVMRNLAKKMQEGTKLLVMADPVFDDNDLRVKNSVLPQEKVARAQSELNESVARQITPMIAVEETGEGGQRYKRLKQTRNLADSLGNLFGPNAAIYTGMQATKRNFMEKVAPTLGQFKEIVFATHGYYGNNLPGISEPVLVLTTVPRGTDGYLRASEVMNLEMNADIVALTACVSGLGSQLTGEGIMNMGRAFQYAGAKSVLMSLWSVEEAASVKLVVSFFNYLKSGNSKILALRLARDEVRRGGYDHPFFWAGFILVGETGMQATPSYKSAQKTDHPKTVAPPVYQRAQRQSHLAGSGSRDLAKEKQLLDAAQSGELSKCVNLLATGIAIECADGKYGATPLLWAAYKGHLDILRLFLEKGANINATNKDGRTALLMAAGSGHVAVVELLLRHKADANIKDKDGQTALDWAKKKNHASIVRLLKK